MWLALWIGCGSTVVNTPATDTDPSSAPVWRSQLYPEDWTPEWRDAEGRFLHDFSYAGYAAGEREIPDVDGPVARPADFGALPDGSDATAGVQGAIDSLTAGGFVEFDAGTYRIDGLLEVVRSGVVLRGQEGTVLQFTRDTAMTDRAHLTFKGALTTVEEVLATGDLVVPARTVEVVDGSTFAVGDSVDVGWTITDAFIERHGMTGTWGPFNGTWQPFFRRSVVAVDGNTLTLDVPHRYGGRVEDGLSVRKVEGRIREVGLENLAVTNRADGALDNDRSPVVELVDVEDSWVRNIHTVGLEDPAEHVQSGGIRIRASRRISVLDSRFENAQNREERGNGYLVEVRTSSDLLIEGVTARNGRHNFIQNWGFGTTGVVFKDCVSSGSLAFGSVPIGIPAFSEFHHSLATANLIEGGTFDDGWRAENRGTYSSGAGHTAAENVFWNVGGAGILTSDQVGFGYIIGPSSSLTVINGPLIGSIDAAPEDWLEVGPDGVPLEPASLFDDQRARRLGMP